MVWENEKAYCSRVKSSVQAVKTVVTIALILCVFFLTFSVAYVL